MRVLLDGKKGKNRYAIVDKKDYDRVSKYRWYYNNGYAVSDFGVRMHRFIMNPPHDTVEEANSALYLMRQGIIPSD